MTPRHGFAYWVSGFPPLDGEERKRRPAIYLDLGDAAVVRSDRVVCIGTSTDPPGGRDHDAMLVVSGLPERCWVYPRWAVETPIAVIEPEAGLLPLVLLEPLINAVIERSLDYLIDPDSV